MGERERQTDGYIYREREGGGRERDIDCEIYL